MTSKTTSHSRSKQKSTLSYLFFHRGSLGDLIVSIPFLKRIRFLHPKSSLYLVCLEGFKDFFEKLNVVDQAFEIHLNQKKESYKRIFEEIKDVEFDEVYSAHNAYRTARFLLKLKARRRISFWKWWNFWVYDVRPPRHPKKLPEVLRVMSLLSDSDLDLKKKLKTTENNHLFLNEKLKIPPWASTSFQSFLLRKQKEKKSLQQKKRVFMAPLSRLKSKCWEPEKFLELGVKLSKEGWETVFIGAKNERDSIQEISNNVPQSQNLAGKTSLYETLCLFLSGRGLITNDSGPGHLAALLELPTVSIFGPTKSEFGWRPWNKNTVVVEKNLSCRSCYLHGPKICPLGTHDCIKLISVNDVCSAFKSLL